MRPIVHAVIAGIAIIAVIMFVAAAIWGCAENIHGGLEFNQITPGGIQVAYSGNIDLLKIDHEFSEVVACWKRVTGKSYPTSAPKMLIRIDLPVDINGPCDAIKIGDALVYGWAKGRLVALPPDLCAWKHEASHYVSGQIRNGIKGTNGEGVCWL